MATKEVKVRRLSRVTVPKGEDSPDSIVRAKAMSGNDRSRGQRILMEAQNYYTDLYKDFVIEYATRNKLAKAYQNALQQDYAEAAKLKVQLNETEAQIAELRKRLESLPQFGENSGDAGDIDSFFEQEQKRNTTYGDYNKRNNKLDKMVAAYLHSQTPQEAEIHRDAIDVYMELMTQLLQATDEAERNRIIHDINTYLGDYNKMLEEAQLDNQPK